MAIGRNPRVLNGSNRLYLDHAATTPILPPAREAMLAALDGWANPSSPHSNGRAARALLESARRSVAEALEWSDDVVFTSGASEAVQIAARNAKVPGRALGATEHEAVLAAMGRARVIGVDESGLIDMAALDEALAGDPALVAVQHVNNETGIVQPLAAIYERVSAAGSLLLADCAQSAGKLPLSMADFIAISAHKFGGPPGAGALLVRDPGRLRAVGGQERGYRRGTENLPAIAGMAAALGTRSFVDARNRVADLRGALEDAMQAEGAVVIAGAAERSAFIGAVATPGVSAAAQLVQFDLAGIAVSAGSACSSGSMKASRVLGAMGVSSELAASTIRVSFGPFTSADDVDRFLLEWRRVRQRGRAEAA